MSASPEAAPPVKPEQHVHPANTTEGLQEELYLAGQFKSADPSARRAAILEFGAILHNSQDYKNLPSGSVLKAANGDIILSFGPNDGIDVSKVAKSLYQYNADPGDRPTVPAPNAPPEAPPSAPSDAVTAAAAPPEGSKPDRVRTLYDGTKRETYRDDKGVSAIVDQDAQGHLVGSFRRNDDGTYTRYNAQGQPVEAGIANLQVDKHAAVHYVNGEGQAVYQHVQRADGQTYREIHQTGDEKSLVVAQDHITRADDGSVKHEITDATTHKVTKVTEASDGTKAVEYPPDDSTGDQTTYVKDKDGERWVTKNGDQTATQYPDQTKMTETPDSTTIEYPQTDKGDQTTYIKDKDGERWVTKNGDQTITQYPDQTKMTEGPDGTKVEYPSTEKGDQTTYIKDKDGERWVTKNGDQTITQYPDQTKVTEGPDGTKVEYPAGENGEQTTYIKDQKGERWVTHIGNGTITNYPDGMKGFDGPDGIAVEYPTVNGEQNVFRQDEHGGHWEKVNVNNAA